MYDEKPGLYLRDCMDAMREFPDKFFDLAIVDPPYGISQPKRMNGAMPSKGWNGTAGRLRVNGGAGRLKNCPFVQANMEWDKRPPDKTYFDELFRVSKNQIIWGGNYFPLPPTRCVVVWDKKQHWTNFSQVEIAWTSFDKPAKIWRKGNTTHSKIHPTQKPVDLYIYLLQTFAADGDRILDTHCGSASSLIACARCGFKAWGYEIDEAYYMSALDRYNRETAQISIYD